MSVREATLLPLSYLNYLHAYAGKIYVIYKKRALYIDRQRRILAYHELEFEFKTAPAANYFRPYGEQNLIFQGNKLFSLQGAQTTMVKQFSYVFKSNICDGNAVSKEQFFELGDKLETRVAGQIRCIPKVFYRVFYFEGQIGVSLEEETSYFSRQQECHQIDDSCLGDMLLCWKNFVIDECYAYYDVDTGQMVYPLRDSFDLEKYVEIDENAQISVKAEILGEYQAEDFEGKPYKTLFGYPVKTQKEDAL